VSGWEADPYFGALAAADEQAAVAYVLGRVDAGADPVDVMLDLVAPAQREVGRRWAIGEWTVVREHAATAVSEAAVAALAARVPVVTAPRGHAAVACAEREWHSLPARLVAHTLRRDGWRATYLGASTPPAQLVRFLDESGADAVAISCSVAASLPAARRLIEAVRESGRPVLAGGPAFGRDAFRALALGASAWTGDPRRAAEILDELVGTAGPAPPLRHAGADEHAELALRFPDFRRETMRRWTALAEGALPAEDLAADLVDHALHALGAALLSNDPGVLKDAEEWSTDLIAARGCPPATARALWTAVRATVGEHLPAADRALAAI
jgi:MerR family transcriptional regulator, light-induced transcriptional regulator